MAPCFQASRVSIVRWTSSDRFGLINSGAFHRGWPALYHDAEFDCIREFCAGNVCAEPKSAIQASPEEVTNTFAYSKGVVKVNKINYLGCTRSNAQLSNHRVLCLFHGGTLVLLLPEKAEEDD